MEDVKSMKPEETKFCDLSIAELKARSIKTPNRLYTRACNLMVSAKEALAIGDAQSARLFYKKAQLALLESQKDEHAQVMSARRAGDAIEQLEKQLITKE